MKLSKLLNPLPSYIIPARSSEANSSDARLSEIEIKKIVSDSRQVEPDTLFVAYQGVSRDGHCYIPEAIAHNAAAIICEDEKRIPSQLPSGQTNTPPIIIVPNGREALAHLSAALNNFPSQQAITVGITGTDGKTTTTNFLYYILRAAHKIVGMINTVNAVLGDTILETGLHTTTPDAPDVQRYLAKMVEAGVEVALLETTSHGLAQHRVTACDFDIAVVTNITHEHLDIHGGSLEAYRAAKAFLFESLATAANKGLPKTAVLNCDDWSFEYLKAKLAVTGTAWLGYSLLDHPEATLTAQNISCQRDKTIFTVHGPTYCFKAATTLLGDYNVSNCLAAVTAATELLGVSPEQAQQGIADLAGVPGRMERIDEGQPFLAIVDFAHTPNSLRRSLLTARTLTTGRVIAVFGCAGLRDVEKRAMMGEVAAELADITIITAEDPRTEDLQAIMTEIATAMQARGAVDGQTFKRIPDRGLAIYHAVQMAKPNDLVIALGKGHEQSICFGQTEYPWDDRQAMRTALNGNPLLTLPSAKEIY